MNDAEIVQVLMNGCRHSGEAAVKTVCICRDCAEAIYRLFNELRGKG